MPQTMRLGYRTSSRAVGGFIALTLVSLAAYSAPPVAGGLVAEVHRLGGLPTFVINGRPHSGICYSTYDSRPEFLSRRVKDFDRAGCDIFNFVVEISGYGYSKPLWPAQDRWEFSAQGSAPVGPQARSAIPVGRSRLRLI